MKTFTETQRFRQWWIWTLLVACFIIVLGGLLIDGFQSFDLVPLLIPLSLVVGFYSMRLDTRIDQSGIRYRFLPMTGWRTIPWAEIRHLGVKTSPFTGYGARWDFEAWHYVIDGYWGLHIDRVKGKRLIIGTQQPDELRRFLETLKPVINE